MDGKNAFRLNAFLSEPTKRYFRACLGGYRPEPRGDLVWRLLQEHRNPRHGIFDLWVHLKARSDVRGCGSEIRLYLDGSIAAMPVTTVAGLVLDVPLAME